MKAPSSTWSAARLDLGLRLGGGLSLGVAGAYEPDVDWTDTLRVGLSYGTWLRRTQAGLEPAVIASVDWDPAWLARGNGRWRTGLPGDADRWPESSMGCHFDGSNLYALAYRIGRAELQTSGGFSAIIPLIIMASVFVFMIARAGLAPAGQRKIWCGTSPLK